MSDGVVIDAKLAELKQINTNLRDIKHLLRGMIKEARERDKQ